MYEVTPNKRKKNKMSSDMRSVSDLEIYSCVVDVVWSEDDGGRVCIGV